MAVLLDIKHEVIDYWFIESISSFNFINGISNTF